MHPLINDVVEFQEVFKMSNMSLWLVWVAASRITLIKSDTSVLGMSWYQPHTLRRRISLTFTATKLNETGKMEK